MHGVGGRRRPEPAIPKGGGRGAGWRAACHQLRRRIKRLARPCTAWLQGARVQRAAWQLRQWRAAETKPYLKHSKTPLAAPACQRPGRPAWPHPCQDRCADIRTFTANGRQRAAGQEPPQAAQAWPHPCRGRSGCGRCGQPAGGSPIGCVALGGRSAGPVWQRRTGPSAHNKGGQGARTLGSCLGGTGL